MPEPDETAVRRALSAGERKRWLAATPMLLLCLYWLIRADSAAMRLLMAAVLLVFVGSAALASMRRLGWGRGPAAPLRRALVEHVDSGEVVMRLDDGSLWGFRAEPDVARSLVEGARLTLPEPGTGAVEAVRRDPDTGELTVVVGKKCRLFRPAPTTYLAPVAALGDADTAGAATLGGGTRGGRLGDLSEGQARAYLTYVVSRSRGRKRTPLRRAVLADIGAEPAAELVEVVAVWADRVRVRRADGRLLSWPVKGSTVPLAPGARLWATRPAEGLYVVLLRVSDEGRRVRVVWPQGRAVAEEPEPPGAPDPPVDVAP